MATKNYEKYDDSFFQVYVKFSKNLKSWTKTKGIQLTGNGLKVASQLIKLCGNYA